MLNISAPVKVLTLEDINRSMTWTLNEDTLTGYIPLDSDH